MSRRTNRSRVSTSRETPPRMTDSASLRPRRWNARSTRNARANASTSVMTALIQCWFASQKPLATSSAGMAAQTNPRAVLLDAMGTLLTFAPPAPLLRAARRERLGVDVGEDAARDAIAAEIAYYRAHFDEGRD